MPGHLDAPLDAQGSSGMPHLPHSDLGTTTRPAILLAVNSLARLLEQTRQTAQGRFIFCLAVFEGKSKPWFDVQEENCTEHMTLLALLDCRGSTGFVILVADTPVIWKAGLQTSIAVKIPIKSPNSTSGD